MAVRDALLLLSLMAIAAQAVKLPALERKTERQERRFMERHGHLRTTVQPPAPAPGSQSGSLDRAPTAKPGILVNGDTEKETEKVAGQQQEQQQEPKQDPEQGQEPQPETEPEREETPDKTPQESKPEAPTEDQGVEGDEVPAGSSNRQMAPQTQQVDQPSVIDSDQTNKNAAKETTTTPEVVTYQPVPDNAYAVFDHHGRICILATINADLEIVYYTEYDERKKLTVRLPDDAEVTGACARDNAEPVISLRWDHFEFSMFFKENDIGNTWYVSDMKLEYDADQFPEAKPRVGRQMLWMDRQMLHTLHLFGTPVDKAYFCTSKQDLDLYNGDGVRSASVILWDLHLQPYVRNGQFGASVNCPGVPVGRRRINETVPLAVGSTLATVTVLTIAGYAVWRHFKVKKFNYDTME
ncbi:uncharacterized protein LOC122364432 [Amphibalanus amphitrite]|uniref:uncharacterized protein LOC122364432 n=1 Tax=Amphibalanus amphitrite TaxID=1232801 RepID=UPI001C904F15|nr:uncharacterized protein LOC122364432 [Amphibalanus amphitrite]